MTVLPSKDENNAHPVADAWRPVIRQIVSAFAEGDYALARDIPSVSLRGPATARQIQDYVEDYGEALVELSDETWNSSVSQWMGTHWHVLIDLWTRESGRSDMVLDLRVFEAERGFRFEIDLVYVP